MEVKPTATRRYKHKDHARFCSLAEMQGWMGKHRRCEGMVWAIFEVLTPEQQTAVLAAFGWQTLSTKAGAA